MNNILYLIYGIPGSGKTTKANELINKYKSLNLPIDHWEADMFFEDPKTGKYNFDPTKLFQAHKWCQEQCLNSMKNKRDVIISNTSLTPKERKPYINFAKEFNYTVIFIEATGNFQNVHNVPEEKIKLMKNKFTQILPDEIKDLITNE